MKNRDVRVYLEDILDSIRKIKEYTQTKSEDEFFENYQLQDSVIRRLEIIGEAVKHIPDDFKDKYPDVAWRDIADTRNVLIHEYFGVKIDRVWKIIRHDIFDLEERIKQIKLKLEL